MMKKGEENKRGGRRLGRQSEHDRRESEEAAREGDRNDQKERM
jgi:hypothetical protein